MPPLGCHLRPQKVTTVSNSKSASKSNSGLQKNGQNGFQKANVASKRPKYAPKAQVVSKMLQSLKVKMAPKAQIGSKRLKLAPRRAQNQVFWAIVQAGLQNAKLNVCFGQIQKSPSQPTQISGPEPYTISINPIPLYKL